MKSKERVLKSLNWQQTDRTPVQIYLTPEVEASLQAHFGGRDIYEALEIDFRDVTPSYLGPIKSAHDGIYYDEWGAGYRRISHGQAGTYDEAVILPLAEIKTLEEVEAYPWPDPDNFEYAVISQLCDRYHDYATCLGNPGYPDIVNGVSRGRGMEQVLIDIVTNDPVGMAIIDRRVEICYQFLRRGLEAGGGKIDILCLGEDCGNQRGRMFSPRIWREVFQPRLQRFYDLGHEFGAKVMMHSCGDTHEIMPNFIDMGLDVLDAMQPEPAGMDPETIRALCKGKLAFCGLISTQHTLPYGTVNDCRAEARHRLDVIAKGGGYIFSPAHCIQPDTPLANILAIYEEALGHSL